MYEKRGRICLWLRAKEGCDFAIFGVSESRKRGQKNGKAGRCGLSENPWSPLPLENLQNNVSNQFIELDEPVIVSRGRNIHDIRKSFGPLMNLWTGD